jgi:hypothetical protein
MHVTDEGVEAMKRKLILSVVSILACCALGWTNSEHVLPLLQFGPIDVTTHAQWASSAGTVAQQSAEADVVVKGRILKVFKPRVFERSPADSSDRFPLKFSVMAFTEALLKVERVYAGDVRGNIRVVQTGGGVPETENHPELRMQLSDDPLFVEGADHVFFLQEISGDPILAPHRKLYRIVNSAGRYDVVGPNVVNYSELPGQRPIRLRDLEREIQDNL